MDSVEQEKHCNVKLLDRRRLSLDFLEKCLLEFNEIYDELKGTQDILYISTVPENNK